MEKPINPLLMWVRGGEKKKTGRGQWLADKVGTTNVHISNICNDKFTPTLTLAMDIEVATKRKVRVSHWVKYLQEKRAYEARNQDT